MVRTIESRQMTWLSRREDDTVAHQRLATVAARYKPSVTEDLPKILGVRCDVTVHPVWEPILRKSSSAYLICGEPR